MRRVFPRRVLNLSSMRAVVRMPSLHALCFVTLSCAVFAGPEGGDVVGGAGSISRSGTTTTINQATDRMAIDWQSYDVNANERVNYIQPDSSSVSLNRILSNRGSQIHGRIDANGQVFLINPNGIIFGENSVVNVGGILASGLSIDPSDFMNGDYAFKSIEGTDGLVINAGLINAATGGNVALIGQQVENDGMISAQLGSVTLAAGKEAIITFDGEGLLGVQITESILQDDIGVDAAVINNGEISAEDGQILLSASASQDIFSQAVNSGVVKQATSVVVDEDGTFTLSAGANVVNTGVLSASGDAGGTVVVLGENVTSSGEIRADSAVGETAGSIELHSVVTTELVAESVTSVNAEQGVGGEIKVLGSNVGLLDESVVEANGSYGGGEVLIGGDRTGANEQIRNAEFIYLGENSRVSVDGVYNGDGGKLITFAENTARIYGELTARGGINGGFGGFIETSGLQGFDIRVTPIADAPIDGGGEWLIDPYNIFIVDGSGDFGTGNTGTDASRIYAANSNWDQIGWDFIREWLDGNDTNSTGRTVRISTTGNGGSQNGDISFSMSTDAVLTDESASGRILNSTLILDAARNVVINNQNISVDEANDQLNLELIAGGNVQITGTSVIDTGGGDFYAQGVNFTAGASSFSSTNIDTDGGVFEVYASGAVNIYDTIITNGGEFIIGGDHDNDGGASTAEIIATQFNSHQGASVINTSSINGGGDISVYTSGNINIGTLIFNDIDANGGASAVNLLFDSTNGSGDITLQTGINYDSPNANYVSNLRLNSGDDLNIRGRTIDNTTGVNLLNVALAAGDDIRVDNGTIIRLSGGYLDLDASDRIQVGSDTNARAHVDSEGGDISIDAGGAVEFYVDGGGIHTGGGDFIIGDAVQVASIIFDGEALIDDIDTETGAADSDSGVVRISSSGSVNVGAITTSNGSGCSGPCGDLEINAGGDITQDASTALVINGTSIFDAGTADIVLQNSGNDFSIVNVVTANDVALVDTNSIEVGNSSVTGMDGSVRFEVSATGDFIQTAATEIRSTNGGDVSLTSGGQLTVVDINASTTDDNVSGGSVTLSGSEVLVSLIDTFATGANASGGAIDVTVSNTFDSNAAISAASTQDVAGDMTVNGTAADNVITVGAGTTWTGGTLTLNGQAGADTFNLNAAVDVNAFGLQDIATADDSNNIFNIGAAITGLIEGESGDDTFNITADGSATIRGRVGDDTFNFTSSYSGSLDGNNDADQFNINDTGITVSIMDTGGGDDNDVLTAYDDANGWLSSANEDGTLTYTGGVVTFQNIEHLQGGDLVDTFNVTHDFTSVSGGVGDDIFTFSASIAGNIFGQDGDDTFDYSGGGDTTGTIDGGDTLDEVNGDLIIGQETNSTWNITAANQGDVEATAGGSDYIVDFQNIDRFQAGSLTDILVGNNQGNYWDITAIGNSVGDNPNSGLATDLITFSNFETLTGNAGVDTFTVDAGLVGVALDINGGAENDVFNLGSSVTGTINGEGDNDEFNILAGGVVATLVGGETGTDVDVVNGLDGSTDSNDWIITSAGTGTVTNNGNQVGFSEVETLGGGDEVTLVGGADDFDIQASFEGTINGGSGDDQFDVTTAVVTAYLNGGAGVDTFDIDFAVTGRIDGGTENDTFHLGANVTDNVQGDDGDDTFNIDAIGITANLIGGTDSGSPNGDVLTINDVGVLTQIDWSLDPVLSEGSVENITFESIENLNGANSLTIPDVFVFTDTGTFGLSVDARLGDDVVDVDDNDTSVEIGGVINGVDGVNTVLGDGTGTVTLINASSESTWTISNTHTLADGVNDGVISNASIDSVNFIDFANLTGSDTQDDVFDIQDTGSVTGTITGGNTSGSDTLQGHTTASDWRLSGAGAGSLSDDGSVPTYVNQFAEIETLEGRNTTNDQLFGANQLNTWTITGAEIGSVNITGGLPATVTNFEGMNTLTGSGEVDTFDIGAVFTGVMNAGAGDDFFNINAAGLVLPNALVGGSDLDTITGFGDTTTNVWTTSADGVGRITHGTDVIDFQQIENLTGGSGVDQFTITNQFTTLSGGIGGDTFNLNAGASVTTVNGGADADNFNVNTAISADLNGEAGADTFDIDFEVTGSVDGGMENDTFHLGANVTNNVQGDAGDDTFNIDVIGITANLIGGADTGAPNGDVLTINDVGVLTQIDWSLDPVLTEGSVENITLESIENLNGANSLTIPDVFVFTEAGTFGLSVDARLGDDVVDVDDNDTSVEIGGVINGVDGVNTVLGDGTGTVTLINASSESTWTISDAHTLADGVDDGVISNASVDTVSFINFANLTGSDTQNDVFDIQDTGSVTGTITGGDTSGSDTLQGHTTASDWRLSGAGAGSLSDDGSVPTYVNQFSEFETLEGRSTNDQLYAADQPNTWTIDIADRGTINETGGPVADEMDFSGMNRLTGNSGVDTFNFTANFAGTIESGANNDAFNINAADLVIPNINGNSGVNTITGFGTENTWVSSANAIGDLTGGSQAIGFTNVENLVGGSGIDTFTITHDFTLINAAGNTDTINLGGNVATVNAGAGGDQITITAPITANINGEDGADTFDIDFSVTGAINGGNQTDTFNIGASGISATVEGGESVSDEDRVVGFDDAANTNAWTITGSEAGNLVNSAGTIGFTEIEAIDGNDFVGDVVGDGSDTFTLGASRNGGIDIDALGGTDTVNISAAGDYSVGFTGAGSSVSIVEGISSIESIVNTTGVSTGRRLVLSTNSDTATSNVWDVTTVSDTDNSGTLTERDTGDINTISFQYFDLFTGNGIVDEFIISGPGAVGDVDGGSTGTGNALTISDAAANSWVISTAVAHSGTFDTNTSFSNIQTITGVGSDSLRGRNQNNDWQITGANSGSVHLVGNSADELFFNGITDVVGGSVDDTFTFGAVGAVALVDGGASGTDRIVGRSTANTWGITDVNEGNVQVTAGATYISDFQNIDELYGSASAADLFEFDVFVNFDIDAGSGAGDVADYHLVADDIDITVGAGAINGLVDVERVVGNNNGINSTTYESYLTLDTSFDANWDISDVAGGTTDGINDGRILFNSEQIDFENFSGITGGSGNDTFDLNVALGNSGISDFINGGGNTATGDSIDARNVTTVWNIFEDNSGGAGNEFAFGNLQYASGAGALSTDFSGVEELSGSDADDTYNVNSFAVGGSFAITLDGGSGTDVLNLPNQDLDITIGQAIAGIGLNGIDTISANAASANSLTVSSLAGANVAWAIDTPNSGSADGTDFENFQTLNGSLGNDHFTFTGTGSIDTAINGGGGTNEIVANSVATRWNITGNNAGSVDDMTGAPVQYVSSFTGIQTLTGSSVSNAFIIDTTGSFTGTITGGIGTDSIEVREMALNDTLWLIDPALSQTGSVQRVSSADNSDVNSTATFTDIDSLLGGSGTDKFIFSQTGVYAGTADAAGGDNVVDLSSIVGAVSTTLGATTINGVDNAERVIGNGANSTLNGLDSGTNTWTISDFDPGNSDGVNDGVLANGTSIEFIDFAVLQGGDASTDNFVLLTSGSISGGSMNGGSGLVDTVTGAADTNTWTLDTNIAQAGNVDGSVFSGIEQINGGSATDTLIGRAQVNNWQVNALDGGFVEDGSNLNRMTFTDMENLEGNSSADNFVITSTGSLSGAIDGTTDTATDGTGDTLRVASTIGQTVNWLITGNSSGSITTLLTNGFSDIDSVVGEAGQDTVTVSGQFNGTIATGDNNDNLILNLGANVSSEILLGTGSDTVTINHDAVVANVNADVVAESDSIILSHTTASDWTFDGATSGSVSSAGTVMFSGIDIVQGNSAVDTVTVDNDFTGSIASFGGNDIFTLNANVGGGVQGGSDDDRFDIAATGLTTDVDGGLLGSDTIRITHTGNSLWTIDGSNTVDGVSFSNMEIAQGNGAIDTFTISSAFGQVNAGAGDDQINIATDGIAVIVDGEGDNDTLTMTHTGDSTWTIDGTNTVDAVAFSNIETAEGNDAQDVVNVTAAFGQINTAGGIDTITLSDSASVNTGVGADVINILVDGISATVDGGVDSDNDTLATTHASTSTWTIDGTNTVDGVGFSNIDTAQGNGAIDTFTISSAFGQVNAGAGDDQINIATDGIAVNVDGEGNDDTLTMTHTGDSTWTIDGTNTVDAVAFSNIETAEGNDEQDVVNVTAAFGQINTAGGIDTITLSDSASVNAGVGADVINILIDGITATVDGGVDSDNDTLATTHASTSTWTIDGTNTVDGVDFSNIDTVQGNGAIDTFTISVAFGQVNAGAGDDQINIATDGIAVNVDGEGNDDTLTMTHAGDSTWTIDGVANAVDSVGFANVETAQGNAGVDVVDVTAAFGTIETLGGNDVVTLTADVTSVLTGGNDDTINVDAVGITTLINSGSGTDELVGPARTAGETNDWLITTGTDILNTNVSFDGVENISGNAGNDHFVLQDNTSVDDVRGAAVVLGAVGGNDTLEIESGTSDNITWSITDSGQGTVSDNRVDNFYGIENLTGGEGVDVFDLTNTGAVISGLIDGGEIAGVDNNTDVVDVTAFTSGIVVELGPVATGSNPQPTLTNIHVNNIEQIDGAPGAGNVGEEDNWLVVTHTNDVQWRLTPFNDGYTQELVSAGNPDVSIPNTRVDFTNFGSFGGGDGNEDSNINAGTNITGEYVAGSGLRNLIFDVDDYAIDQLIVVDIDDRVASVTGNGNTVLRVSADAALNVNNDWLVNAINAGSFTANPGQADEFSMTFTSVNQLSGGTGIDTFTIADTGNLVNGSINGGAGTNTIVATSATSNLAFGLNEMRTGVPVTASYPAGIASIDLLASRDGVIDVINISDLQSNSAVTTSLYSGDSADYAWTLDSAGNVLSGNLNTLNFSGIDNVVGGAGNDTFNVGQLNVVSDDYNGGDGTDTINFLSGVSAAVDVSLDPSVTVGIDVQLAEMEVLNIGDNGNTLYGGSAGNVWTLSSVNDGAVIYDNGAGTSTLSYTNFSHLVGGAGVDTFAINDVVDDDGASSAWGTIAGAGGADVITVAAASNMMFQVSTLDVDNRVNDNADTTRLDIVEIDTVNANSSQNNTLFAREDSDNDWSVTGVASSVTDSVDSFLVAFSGFQNLIGAAGQDSFSFDGAVVSGLVDGGANLDAAVDSVTLLNLDNTVLHLGNRTTGDFNVANVEQLDASGAGYELIADDAENTWQITVGAVPNVLQPNAGTDVTFAGFENLTGGSANDTFNFNNGVDLSLYSMIDGGVTGAGTPVDEVSLISLSQGVVVSLDAAAVGADLYVDNTEVIEANNVNALSNQIIADNVANIWDIDGTDIGTINETVVFSGFANLTGNENTDRFVLGAFGLNGVDSITGLIDGAGNNDVVDTTGISSSITVALHNDLGVTADLNVVNVEDVQANGGLELNNTLIGQVAGSDWVIGGVNTGTVESISFGGFASLTGGDGVDTVTLDGIDAVTGLINTGAGSDTLDISGLSNAVTVAIGALPAADIHVSGAETINASALGNTLIAEDEINTWNLSGVNAGQLMNANYTVNFDGFANLTGGIYVDTFNFNREVVIDDQITGVINGGDDADVVNIVGLVDLQTVAIGIENTGDMNLVSVNQINASTPNAYELVADNVDNTWTIQGADGGVIDDGSGETVTFDGFGNLIGGTADDTFILARQGGASVDDSVSGFIDGGVSPTTGTSTDTVNLEGLVDAVSVSFDASYVANLQVLRVENINAATANNNTLVGSAGENSWNIEGLNSGEINDTAFSGFSNLIGRDLVDNFSFTDTGSVDGFVDGGNQPDGLRDIVDISALSDVQVVIGDIDAGFINIEEYRGSGINSILTAENIENDWNITGVNTGTIIDENGNNIAFSDFDILEGGSDQDNFVLSGGSIEGEIRAGDGNDNLAVDVIPGVNGEVTFVGGNGSDTVAIVGGNSEYTTQYTADAAGNVNVVYAFQDINSLVTYAVNYSSSETVNDDVQSSLLTVNDIALQADVILVADNSFTINSMAEVNYDNKESVSFIAESGDVVNLDGTIQISNRFEVANAAVNSVAEDANIQALQVVFNNNDFVGAADARIQLNTDNVQLESVQGNVYLQEANDLVIAGITNAGGVTDIVANGNITDSAVLASSQAIIVQSNNADIVLDNANNLTGEVSLSAAGRVTLVNNASTSLGNVTAQNADLTINGNLSDVGAMTVSGTTTITSNGSNVILDNAANNFGSVAVNNAADVMLTDTDDISVEGSSSDGFGVTALQNINTTGGITAEDISLTSTAGAIGINNTLSADNTILLSGVGVSVNGTLTVDNNLLGDAVIIDGTSGTVELLGQIDTSNATASAGDVLISGDQITQQTGANIVAGDLMLTSATGISQGANVTAEALVTMTANNGDIVMQPTTVTRAFEVNLTASGDIVTQQIVADTLTLSGANIRQFANADIANDVNIDTQGQYELAAGAQLNVANGDVLLTSNSVEINGDITIDAGLASVASEGNTVIDGAVNAVNILVDSDQEIAMAANGSLTATENIDLVAQGNIGITTLTSTASVTLTSNDGAITDNNADSVNVIANELSFVASSGVGAMDDALDTQVSVLNGLNASGDVSLSNTGDVSISILRNNGDISLTNVVGDVVLVNTAEVDYDQLPTDARDAGGVINGNYDSGYVSITLSDGDLIAFNPPGYNLRRPDLVGDFIEVNVDGNFADNSGRPIVAYATTEVRVSASGGVRPYWGFGVPPRNGLTGPADLIDSSAAGSVSDLLVNVEAIEEIDPAVFTEVRNYSYDSISIRMPRDQLYDDDESFEEDDSEEDEELLL